MSQVQPINLELQAVLLIFCAGGLAGLLLFGLFCALVALAHARLAPYEPADHKDEVTPC